MNRLVAEIRSEVTGNTLVGHAATFETMAKLPNHYERISPSAFDEALTRDSVQAFFNHDTGKPLGSTSAGNLRLSVDKRGLAFELDLPEVSYAQDVRELVRSGILNSMSFGFVPGQVSRSLAPDGKQIVTHESVARLVEISPVSLPAYEGTDLSLRSLDSFTFDRPTGRPKLTAAKSRLILLGEINHND